MKPDHLIGAGHLCGWNAYDSPSILLLRKGRKPWLLVAHHRMKMMALANLKDIDVEWIDQSVFGPRLHEELTRDGAAAPRRIGICGWEDMLAKPWATIQKSFTGAEFVDIAARIVPLRAVKEAEQIATHRKVAAVCDEMFDLLGGLPVIGRPTYDIKAELECLAQRRGCDFVQHWMTTGVTPDYPRYFHHENRQVVEPGHTILYGMMMTIDGIWSHAVRCYYVGEPEPWRVAAQEAVVDYQANFIRKMRPGAELVDLVAEALRIYPEMAKGFPGGRADMLRLGHAMGCSYTEPGISEPFPRSFYSLDDELRRSRSVILKAGMLYEIHPMFLFEGGAAGVGDIVLVGESGTAPLTSYPRGLKALAA